MSEPENKKQRYINVRYISF